MWPQIAVIDNLLSEVALAGCDASAGAPHDAGARLRVSAARANHRGATRHLPGHPG
jgi:hypothetical protein